MSNNGRIQVPSDRENKRARFAGGNGRRVGASPLVLVAGVLAAIAIISGVAFAVTRPSPGSIQAVSSPTEASSAGDQQLLVAATHGHAPYTLVTAESQEVRLPLDIFDDHQAHHYTYMHQGSAIEFFALKSSDGVVRAAFNACDVCFGSKLGYSQEGENMVCNNCGRRFPADQINVLQGGCNPSPLNRSVDGDMLVIRSDDIVQGIQYF